VSRGKKILTRSGTALLCLAVALAAALLVLQAFANNGKALPGGYRPLVVLSGSMEPAMPVGSVVLTKSVVSGGVDAGDIITFALTSDMTGRTNPFATHRVVRVVEGETGRGFVTKGDANNAQDPSPVPAERLIGKVVLVVPYVGHLTHFVQSPFGLILMILLPGAILVIWEGIDLVRRRTKIPQTVAMIVVVLMLCFVGAAQAGLAAGA
jgi:signal peptidase